MASNALNLLIKFTGVDKLSGGIRNMISSSTAASRSLRNLRDEEKRLRTELRDVNRSMQQSGGNLTSLINRQNELERSLAGVNRQMQRQRDIMSRQARAGQLSARADQMKSSGMSDVASGTAMLSPFVIAAKGAMDFSSGMVDIQQKANLTNRETSQMAGNILNLAKATHQLPENMRAGVDVLAGFGLDPRMAIQMIGPVGKLGAAYKVDLADGAAAVFSNLNNLKVPMADTMRALDMMAASGNAGAFEVKDMARWFPALTAQMQALGQKGVPAVADLSAALQVARRATGDADSAGNNIQNLLAKIQAPATIRAFKKNFGVDLPAALRRAYAQGKTPLEAIAELTQKATGGDLSKIGYAFEDMQAQSALRALIQNLEDYRKIRADAAKAGGTIDKAFSQRELQDASTHWRSFMTGLQTFGIIVGLKIMPAANQLLGNLTSLMSTVGDWAERNPRLASGLLQLAGTVALAKIAIGGLKFTLGGIIGPFAQTYKLLQSFRAIGGTAGIIAKVAGAFGTLRTAMLALGSGIARAAALMMASPMILLIVGIGLAVAGLAYLIYTHWDTIKAAFQRGWQFIKDTLSGAGEYMKSVGRMMMDGLLLMLDPARLAQKLLGIAKAGIAAFKNFFGIKSPSRVMMQMGGHVATGLAMGLDQGGRRPIRSMGRLAAGVAGAGALSFAGSSGAMAPPGSGFQSSQAPQKIEIHVHQQPGESGEALARRVAALIKRGGGGGGSYGDDS